MHNPFHGDIMTESANKLYSNDHIKAGLRWFGPDDIVTIANIRQTPGITNVITALHHIAPGEVWTEEEVCKRKIEVEFAYNENAPTDIEPIELYEWHQQHSSKTGLYWCTAESLVFTEEVKNGSAKREQHIENYKKSLKNLGKFGVTNVIGNFMLVADWTRTDITTLDDGSRALIYDHKAFMSFDIYLLKRHDDEQGYIDDGSYTAEEVTVAREYWQNSLSKDKAAQEALTKMITAGLPGAQEGFSLDDFREAVNQYKGMTADDLRENIRYFLEEIIPVATDAGVRLCCHIDDPAFSPFLGTPRAVGTLDGCKFLLDQGCGINLCVGSLLPNFDNRNICDLIYQIADYGKSIGLDIHQVFPHVHLRPIETDGLNFTEGHHAEHREELAQVAYTLTDLGWKGVFRPDHAPSPDHGFGRPGYDLVGRGYGAQLLLGLFEMARLLQSTRRKSIESVLAATVKDSKDAVKKFNEVEKEQMLQKIPHIKKPWSLK